MDKVSTNINVMFRLLVVAIYMFVLGVNVFAQNSERMLVNGIISDRDGKAIEKAEVILLKSYTEIGRINSSGKGYFEFHLELDQIYDIRVVKEGFSPKVVRLKTDVPKEAREITSFDLYEVSVWTYNMPITLFEIYNNLDLDILKEPVAIIHFNPEENEFVVDQEHQEKIKLKIEKLHEEIEIQEKEYTTVIEKADSAYAAGELKMALSNYNSSMNIKVGEEPMKRIKELSGKISVIETARYNELIILADSAMKEEQYEEVAGYYKEAVVLRPNESFVRAELDRVNIILAEIEFERIYMEVITNAEKAMGDLDYTSATVYYNEALEMKPDDPKPQGKLILIDNIVTQMRIDSEYATNIGKADSLFMSGQFDSAQFYYIVALDLKPTEEHALTRVQEIEKAVAEIKRVEAARLAKIEEERLAELALEEQRALEEEEVRAADAALKEVKVETIATEERDEEAIRRELESKIAMEEEHEQQIRQAEAIRAAKEKQQKRANKKIDPASLETGAVASEHNPVVEEPIVAQEEMEEELNLTAEVILKNIITKRTAEALVQSQIVEAKAVILQDEMQREAEVLTFNEMKNYIAKAKSKKLFLEEIAESRKSMRLYLK